jgi:8-oxo-dGTP pyrophosphatase MutT (NUDIX family)
LVINPKGEVLAVSRRENHTDFGLPGGSREGLESPVITAIRETWEETRVKLYEEHMAQIHIMLGYRKVCATYLALKYDDSLISQGDAGVVSWVPFTRIMSGTFQDYNRALLESIVRARNLLSSVASGVGV